jgi:hypothetical protein
MQCCTECDDSLDEEEQQLGRSVCFACYCDNWNCSNCGVSPDNYHTPDEDGQPCWNCGWPDEPHASLMSAEA